MVSQNDFRTVKLLTSRIALGLALCISAGLVIAGPPEAAPGAAISAAHRAFPKMTLPDRVYGEQAIAAVGSRLPEVAAWYGMSTADFARILREDSTAWLDRDGRLFYVEPAPEEAEPFNPTDPLQPALFPLSETFKLNSRPGSKRVIYLDFDGHQTSGTAWNKSPAPSLITSPAYTTDANTAFSDGELQNIQNMWKQVAEDYAPFDVNVTTQDPGLEAITRSSTGDEYYGTRVVITQDNFDNCGCGGFAYLTAFNDIGDYYKPAFVFNTGLVGAGEAISHEVGHNLSLNHDGVTGGAAYYQGHGSGATGWAPIMGVGYYQKLVQWSKGEYSGANNTEDDIAKIPSYGATLMVDDHSDTSIGASLLNATANGGTSTLSGRGLIHLRSDIDYFSFVSGAGSYSFAVNPAPYSPNLDIQAKLYNSAGTLIATSNPVDSLPATLSGSLAAAGTYYLGVEGIGKGDPLTTGYFDYGSIGRYTVSGTVPSSGSLVAPVAVAAAPDYAPGYAPLYVGFDGTGSSDDDGDIVLWNWNFGDGTSASGESVNHTYNAPGTYTVTLTVADNHGLTANSSLPITVLNPVLVQHATGEVLGAGTVTGTYVATQAVGGSVESIRERLSGGSKSSRYSYLEHTWLFNVQAGNSVTFNVTGRRSASTDGDTMVFAYSVNGGATYVDFLPAISLGTATSNGSFSAALPTATSGNVRIKVRDSDRKARNVALDTVYIDEMNITTLNQASP